jgi:hypothetical protein
MTTLRPMPPGMRRILAWLQDNPEPVDAASIAKAIHVGLRQAQYILRQLHTDTPPLIHVAAWRKQTGATWRGREPIRLWAFGTAQDAPQPTKDDAATVRRRRVQRLRDTYGHEMTTRILYDSGVDTIHSNGLTYHKRAGHGRNGAKHRAAA